MARPSNKFIVDTLSNGRIWLVTPEGEVYVSHGRHDANRVAEYLDRGYHPARSAKWDYSGRAGHEDLLRLADRRAFESNRHGCECCDGEGAHDPSYPCG